MIFEKFDEKSLEELLKRNGITADRNYLLATRHRGLVEGTVKLFVNGIYNMLDAGVLYLLVFCENDIIFTKLTKDLIDLIKNKEVIYFQRFHKKEIDSFSVSTKLTKHLISWNSKGKEYSFEIDKFQGIYGFVKENFRYLKENNFNIKGE